MPYTSHLDLTTTRAIMADHHLSSLPLNHNLTTGLESAEWSYATRPIRHANDLITALQSHTSPSRLDNHTSPSWLRTTVEISARYHKISLPLRLRENFFSQQFDHPSKGATQVPRLDGTETACPINRLLCLQHPPLATSLVL
jgi:hypothetical protein